MTEMQALNYLLEAIGETPLADSIDPNTLARGSTQYTAYRELTRTTNEVLNLGWWFNQNLSDGSVIKIPFSTIASSVIWFIVAKAARRYQTKALGSSELMQELRIDEQETFYTALKEHEEHYCIKEVLSRGWWFNRYDDWSFTPDINGYIVLSEDILKLDGSAYAADYVVVDNKLFDKTNKTFIFQAPVTCSVVFNIPFDSIPPTAQLYIKARAARKAAMRAGYPQSKVQEFVAQEQDLYVELQREDIESSDANIVRGNKVLSRTSNPSPQV